MPEEVTKTVVKEPEYHNIQHIVYYIVGAIVILLLFRLGFKVTGANPASGFVAFIYSFSDFFIAPFKAIFDSATAPGAETTAIFEPSILIAMVVYAIIGWGIAKLIGIVAGRPHDVE